MFEKLPSLRYPYEGGIEMAGIVLANLPSRLNIDRSYIIERKFIADAESPEGIAHRPRLEHRHERPRLSRDASRPHAGGARRDAREGRQAREAPRPRRRRQGARRFQGRNLRGPLRPLSRRATRRWRPTRPSSSAARVPRW